MNVGGVSNTTPAAAPAAKPAERVQPQKGTEAAAQKTDKFVGSSQGYTPAYGKAPANNSGKENAETGKTDKTKGAFVNKSALQTKNESMKDMVMKLIGNQSAGIQNNALSMDSILAKYGIKKIESDGSEDFWGAEKTAQRILDFAKSLGADEKSIATLRKAVDTAFGQCEGIWGGKLPGVCYDTYDLIQKGFDEWEKEVSGKVSAE